MKLENSIKPVRSADDGYALYQSSTEQRGESSSPCAQTHEGERTVKISEILKTTIHSESWKKRDTSCR